MNSHYYFYDYNTEYYDYDDKNTNFDKFKCYCDGNCPGNENNNVCEITKKGGKCFNAISYEIDESGDKIVTTSYGCIDDEQMALLQCKGSIVPHLNKKNIICCDQTDFCNKKSQHPIKNQTSPPEISLITIITSIITILFISTIITLLYLKYRKKTSKESIKIDIKIDSNQKPDTTTDLYTVVSHPVMVQRTISKQIDLNRLITKGRYSEIWISTFREEKVVAKIYDSTHQRLWHKETEFYRTILMRHENILGFIAADVKDNDRLLVITDYHENRSLFDYLRSKTIEIDLLLMMSIGISKGLSHLHTEIFGKPGKPAIAHNNLKSKNILVKRNLECCLSDFTQSVTCSTIDSTRTDTDFGNNRYKAPEILSGTIDSTIDAYKMADVYSFGLILWEMANRCNMGAHKTSSHNLPFEDLTSKTRPDVEEMRQIVCVHSKRPSVPNHWTEDATMTILSKIMRETWHENPTVRLTALRIKKTLYKTFLARKLFQR